MKQDQNYINVYDLVFKLYRLCIGKFSVYYIDCIICYEFCYCYLISINSEVQNEKIFKLKNFKEFNKKMNMVMRKLVE